MTYQDVVNIIRDAANFVNPNGFFVHGRKTDGSLQYNEATPQIILLEPQPNTSINNNSFFETTVFPIIFVTQDSPESTEVERENIKQSMYLLSRKLLAKIDEQPLLQDVQYTGGQPEIRQLSGTMTGFSYSLQLSYPLSECSLDFDLPPTIKLFATQTTVASGTTVQIGWIAENVNSVVITPFGTLQGQFGFVNTTITSTASFVGTATNDAGTATDTLTITVSNGCDDATAVLKNTAGTTLSTTDIPSGDTQDIIAPNATILINGVNSFPTIPSGGSENIVLENTQGTPVGTYDGDTNSWVTPDIDVLVNSVVKGQVPSVTDVKIELEDSGGNPVTPTSVNQSGNTFTIEVPSTTLAVDFSADATTPVTNQTVTFTDLTVGATSWLWDFGDGNLSTLQNPTHEYLYAGTYTVTLFASDGTAGGEETKSGYITVSLQSIPSTNLQAHYPALTGVTPANATLVSGVISQWDDIVGGYNVTQGSATSRPNYNSSLLTAPDGTVYGGAEFDGSNDFLDNTDAGFTRADGNTLYVFYRHNARVAAVRNVFNDNGNGSIIQIETNTVSLRISATPSATAYPVSNFYLLRVTFSATVAEIEINNLMKLALGVTSFIASAGFKMCSNISPANITIIEAAIYSATPSAGQEAEIIEYFNSKFGGVICQ